MPLDSRPVATGGAAESLAHWQVVAAAARLDIVLSPDVNLAIWARRLPTVLSAWLARVDLPALGSHRWELPVDGLAGALRRRLGPLPLPAGPGRAAFAADLAALAERHAALTGAETVQVRLEAIDHDACRRFHTDAVGIRLITTYVGPGTQWIDGAAGVERTRQLAAGHVGLFKGAAWGDGTTPGILHRSPPMAGTGRFRLLAVVDAVRDDDDGHWHG